MGITEVVGVIDGHGKNGELAAEFIRDNFVDVLLNSADRDWQKSFTDAYMKTDQQISDQLGDSPGAVGVILGRSQAGWKGMYVGDPTVYFRTSENPQWRWPLNIDQQSQRFPHSVIKEMRKTKNGYVQPKTCWGHPYLNDWIIRKPKFIFLPSDAEIILASDIVGEQIDRYKNRTGSINYYMSEQSSAQEIAGNLSQWIYDLEEERVNLSKELVLKGEKKEPYNRDDITVLYLR